MLPCLSTTPIPILLALPSMPNVKNGLSISIYHFCSGMEETSPDYVDDGFEVFLSSNSD